MSLNHSITSFFLLHIYDYRTNFLETIHCEYHQTLMAIKLKEEHDEKIQEQAWQHEQQQQQRQSSRNREVSHEKKDIKGLQSTVKGKSQIQSVNPRTGHAERVFVNLELVYPNADDPMAEEYCFEELRARHRGWMDRDWKAEREERERRKEQQEQQEQPNQKKPFQQRQISTTTTTVATRETVESVQVLEPRGQGQDQDQVWLLAENMQAACKIEGHHKLDKDVILGDVVTDVNDENAPPSKEELEKAALARRLRREERANRTRKIKVMEVKGTTQTSMYKSISSSSLGLALTPLKRVPRV